MTSAPADAATEQLGEPEVEVRCGHPRARAWNELGHFIIATSDPHLYTLTRGVAGLTSGGLGAGNQFPIRMAAALLMTIPTALVFVVFQRFFTQGANVGAEKG